MRRNDPRTYITVHDGLPDHPKITGLSDKAFRVLVTGWCWCSRYLTDGVMPMEVWQRQGTAAARLQLLASRMVVESDDHRSVAFHDYLEHQRSADQVAELREKRRAAGQRGGEATANAKASAAPNAEAKSQQTRSKVQAESETETELPTSVRENAEVSSANENVYDLRSETRGPKVTPRMAEIVKSYTSRVKPADAPRISALITNAMGDWTMEQAAVAVLKLAKDRRPFTAETFRYELEATGPDRTGVTYGRDGSKRAPNGVVRNRAGEIIGGGGPGTGKTLWWGS
jgi:hypothetical protein